MTFALPTADQRRDLPILALFLGTSAAVAIVSGFGLGWWLLLHQTFGAPLPDAGWLALVQVHGHAQLMGFAALLVMGIGYRLLPRFRAAPEPALRLVLASYALVVAGLVLRTAQLADPFPGRGALLLASGAFELAGTLIYATTAVRTLAAGANAHRPDELLIAAGAAWSPVAALWNLVALDPVIRGGVVAAADADASAVAALLVGTIGGHVLGVSLRVASGFIAARPAPDRGVLLATILWTGGTSLLVFRLGAGTLLLLAAAAVSVFAAGLVGRGRAVRALPEGAGVTRLAFRSAYAWLVVGLSLLALDAFSPDGSHPLVVAGRHALAVGFLAPMVYGVGARLLPTLTGGSAVPVAAVRWAVILTNAAAVLRVGFEIVGPSTTAAAIALAASAPVGLAGLAVFAAGAARTVRSTIRGLA